MKLVIYNGSPRREKSNSTMLMNRFLNGYHKIIDNDVIIHYLANTKNMSKFLADFNDADAVLVVFPLYTDAMPGIVKEFFEALAKHKPDTAINLGFIVQSGFPEGIHCENILRYLKKFTSRIGCQYLGTLTKGGVEGIQVMPPFMTRKLFSRFHEFGEHFARTGSFSEEIIRELNQPYKMSLLKIWLLKFLIGLGVTNLYWNTHLKKNKAFQNRFDRPFVQ